MSHARDDARVRLAARLAGTLLATPDAGLERFRDRRVADVRLRPEDLKVARDVLDAVGFALAGTDRANWRRIRQAWEIVRRNAPPEVADPTPAPPHPARVAETERSPRFASRPVPEAVTPSVQVDVASAPATGARLLPHPPAAASGEDLDATRGIDVSLVARAALPFSDEVRRAPPRALTDEPHPEAGGTSLAIPTLPGDELPFSSTQASAVAKTQDDLDGTRDLVALSFEDDPLPFKPPSSSPNPASSLADEATHPDAGATSFMIPALSLGDDLPFETTRPPPVALTVPQYASFVVDCEEASDQQAVRRRYGIADDEAAKTLAAHWRRRLGADASERTEFERLVAAYRQWLRERRGQR